MAAHKAFLHLLGHGLLGLAVDAAAALGAAGCHTRHIILGEGAVDVLLEHGLWVEVLELGLKVLQACGVGGAVGAAACVIDVEAFVLDLFTVNAPGKTVSEVVGFGISNLCRMESE